MEDVLTRRQIGPDADPMAASVREGEEGSLDLLRFIETLKAHHELGKAFVHHRHIPARPAVYGQETSLHPEIRARLTDQGIDRLYSHQWEAVSCLRRGGNVLVATPTASGKSLIYNVAVMEEILKDPECRAVYLFPLKALEQDQLKALQPWLVGSAGAGISAAIYDGDTTPYRRKQIRANPPNVLFTNPDMLHRGILAHHRSWEVLMRNLRFVIMDEIHTYRGIFGSHVNQIVKRLKRICAHYGSRPKFVLLSATISNPAQFGSLLIEEPLQVVADSGAPQAGRHFVLLNPMASPNFSSARLFADCIRQGLRTIVFTQSRKVTELIHLWVSRLSPELRRRVSSYRAGFLPQERRKIERDLAAGSLLGVVSTSALEMGIDIGHLDVCLLVGYPGTIINLWQRGGRVGRSGRDSLVILVAKPDALDQYFMKHPDALFDRPYEAAVMDPDNPYVVEAHLPCAAAESPIHLEDERYWKKDLGVRLRKLEETGELHRAADPPLAWFASRKNPHLGVDIRSAGATYTIFDGQTGEAVGTIDGLRAFKECHPGAAYLHRARQYLVDHLVLDKKDVVVRRTDLQYFTRARTEKETEIMAVHRSRPRGQFLVRQGDLKVTERVTGYEKRALPGQELMGVLPLELPSETFETVGFWIELEDAFRGFVEQKGLHFMGGIHAIEHAAIGIFPLFALCDRNDIGGISHVYHPQIQKSAIFIYDGYPGGVGLAQRGFDIVLELLEKAYEVIKTCECEEGCPSCIHSPKCGNGNKPLDKRAALLILEGLLGRIPLSEMCPSHDAVEIDPLPTQPPPTEDGSPGPRILFLDLETRRSAEDVGGWRNAHLMGVSVAVIFDSLGGEYHVYDEDGLDALFERLRAADLIVGFNVKRFDYVVLSAYTSQDLKTLPTFDILEDLHQRLGFRLSLDHLAKETLGKNKAADGLQAIAWFRDGELEKLRAYCSEDVAITRDLFRYGLERGEILFRQKQENRRIAVRVDWNLENMIKMTRSKVEEKGASRIQ